MKIKFYKLRAIILLYIVRIFGKILSVEIPPSFSVAAIIEKEKKLLFLDLTYLNGYCLPGGHVRAGENLDEALVREVLEETGLKVMSSKIYKSYSSKLRGFPQVVVAYFVEVEGILKESDEGKLYWIKPEEVLGKLAYKDNEKIVKDLIRK